MKKRHLFLFTLFVVSLFYFFYPQVNASEQLRLVNHTYTMNRSALPQTLTPIAPTHFYEVDGHVEADPLIIPAFQQMMQRAYEENVTHFIVNSGFRSFQSQRNVYKTYGAPRALKPKQSEHHTGLALDIGSTVGLMENTEEGKWLQQNVWDYGFIMRYPAHKTDVTQIQSEPWHIRYVGLPHSLLMKHYDLVLEEYIAYLHDAHTVTYGDYTIHTLTKREYQQFLKEHADVTYDASFDGTGFVIVTIHNG